MEEITDQTSDPRVAWQIIYAAYKCVCKRQFAEAERWIMYAKIKGPYDELTKACDTSYLSKGLNKMSLYNKLAAIPATSPDLLVLKGLLQNDIQQYDQGLATLKAVVKGYPKYAGLSQVKAMVLSLGNRDADSPIVFVPERSKKAPTPDRTKLKIKWNADDFPLKVYVPTDLEGKQVSGYVKGDGDILRRAFETWQQQTAGLVNFAFVNSPKDADITCTWVSDQKLLLAKDRIGMCRTSSTTQGCIINSEVNILTYKMYSGALSAMNQWKNNYLNEVCLHEAGHSLGLKHSRRQVDIMFDTAQNPPQLALTEADIATLKNLYQATP